MSGAAAALAVLAGLALVTGAGAGLIGLLAPRNEEEGDPFTLGWCFLGGAALVVLLLHLPLTIDGRLPRAAVLVVLGVCLVLSAGPGRAHVRRVGLARFFGLDLLRGLSPWRRGIAVGLAVLAAATALGPLNGWDERAIYALKARILAHEGTVRAEAFLDTDHVHSQARYPLAIPLLEASLLVLKGSADDEAVRLLFVLFGLSLVLVVAGEARRLSGPASGAFWGLLLLTTPMLISPAEGHGMTAYADLPLAAFVTGATVLAGRSLERTGRADVGRDLLAGLLLGAALATKQEGALWAVALGGGFLLALFRRGGSAGSMRSAARMAVPALLLLALSAAARRWIPPSPWSERYALAFSPDWLRQLARRPLDIAPFVLRQLADWKEWAWGWPLVAVGLVALRRPRLPPAPTLWRVTALTVFVADLAVFVVTPNHVHWHLHTAYARLLLQLLPLAFLILAEQVAASGWRLAATPSRGSPAT